MRNGLPEIPFLQVSTLYNFIYPIYRQEREPVFREDTGIALATKVEVIKEGRRIGKNIEIIPYEQNVDFIDIHSEFDLWLSQMLINEKNIYPNEEL